LLVCLLPAVSAAGFKSASTSWDSDVSREVPSAMEPLARLMADDETR
jgi:hypothetical protein